MGRDTDDSTVIPFGAPFWPSLLLGVLVAGMLAYLADHHGLPGSLAMYFSWRTFPGHAIFLTLLPPVLWELRTILQLRREIPADPQHDHDGPGWFVRSVHQGINLVNDKRLQTVDTMEKSVSQQEAALRRQLQSRQGLFFAIPLAMVVIGLIGSFFGGDEDFELLSNTQKLTPLFLATGEALFCVIAAMQLVNHTDALFAAWNIAARKLCSRVEAQHVSTRDIPGERAEAESPPLTSSDDSEPDDDDANLLGQFLDRSPDSNSSSPSARSRHETSETPRSSQPDQTWGGASPRTHESGPSRTSEIKDNPYDI